MGWVKSVVQQKSNSNVLVSEQQAARKEKVYLMTNVSFSLTAFTTGTSGSGAAFGRTGLYVSPRTMMIVDNDDGGDVMV